MSTCSSTLASTVSKDGTCRLINFVPTYFSGGIPNLLSAFGLQRIMLWLFEPRLNGREPYWQQTSLNGKPSCVEISRRSPFQNESARSLGKDPQTMTSIDILLALEERQLHMVKFGSTKSVSRTRPTFVPFQVCCIMHDTPCGKLAMRCQPFRDQFRLPRQHPAFALHGFTFKASVCRF